MGNSVVDDAPSHNGPCALQLANGTRCPAPVVDDNPLRMCAHHLLAASDWMNRSIGVTDILPAPCLACASRLGVHYESGWLCAICEWRVGDIPDQDAFVRRVDVVYYIRYRGRIKIGTSGNPRRRLASLPHEKILAFERGDRMLEQRRHAQFASHRIARTEWFEEHDALSDHIAEICAGVTDPWARYALWVSQQIALRG